MTNDKYKQIPGVDTILNSDECKEYIKNWGREIVVFAVRTVLSDLRAKIDSGKTVPKISQLLNQIKDYILFIVTPALKPVINATGIVLHTNLGRAPLGSAVVKDIELIGNGYSNVEFDLNTAKRGQRNSHVSELIKYLTGCEDAIVVNNNAAAIILVLNTFAKRKEVPISRGELIEIGGSFRIPDIMKTAGAKMVEVGTTNKTSLKDYEDVISEKTSLLFKAHKSNYAITGFTTEVSVEQLATLAHKHNLPFVYDIGSGLIRKPKNLPLQNEPDVQSAIKAGADIVTFSCDKLLGGPQGGIIAGRSDLIKRLAKFPLMRALRVGKLTLSALSSALRHYITDESLIKNNPAFATLSQPKKLLLERAEKLNKLFKSYKIESNITDSNASTGGGTLPELKIPSYAVAINISKKQSNRTATKFHKYLLKTNTPILGILREGKLLFDVSTVADSELNNIVIKVKDGFDFFNI